MFELKQLAPEAIPAALAKAERYRLLNEPHEAESICRDVLAARPDHEGAMVTLLLALSDQFAGAASTGRVREARDLVDRLRAEYDRAYYGGIVFERWAKAELEAGSPSHTVYHWVHEALERFRLAEELAPPGNPDAILRWNACVRLLTAHPDVRPKGGELDEDEIRGDEPPG